MSINDQGAEIVGIELSYKQLFDKLIGPVLLFMTIFMVASHFRNDLMFWSAVGLIIPVFAVNQILVIRNWKVWTPFGSMYSRTDTFDALRWVITFSMDVVIVWLLQLTRPELLALWMLLSFAGLVEVHRNELRYFSLGAAIATFLIAMFLIPLPDETPIITRIFLLSSYLGVLAYFIATEQFLKNTHRSHFNTSQAFSALSSSVEQIKHNAVIGSQLQVFVHEINNALMVMGVSVDMIFKSESKAGSALKRSFEKIQQLKHLLLDQLGGRKFDEVKREISLQEVGRDVETMIKPQVEKMFATQVSLDFPEEIREVQFVERQGSMFYVLYNLVKNAAEALNDAKSVDPQIHVRVRLEGSTVHFLISDNGPGLSEEMIEKIHNKTATTSKSTGHGWGTYFVVTECEKSQFKLDIKSVAGQGTVFQIAVPVVLDSCVNLNRREKETRV